MYTVADKWAVLETKYLWGAVSVSENDCSAGGQLTEHRYVWMETQMSETVSRKACR